jgi:hypothetical protein
MEPEHEVPFSNNPLEQSSFVASRDDTAKIGSQWARSSHEHKRLCFGIGSEQHSRPIQGLPIEQYDNGGLEVSRAGFYESGPTGSAQFQKPQPCTPCPATNLPGFRDQFEAPVSNQFLWPLSQNSDNLNASLPGFHITPTPPAHPGQNALSLPSLQYWGNVSTLHEPPDNQFQQYGVPRALPTILNSQLNAVGHPYQSPMSFWTQCPQLEADFQQQNSYYTNTTDVWDPDIEAYTPASGLFSDYSSATAPGDRVDNLKISTQERARSYAAIASQRVFKDIPGPPSNSDGPFDDGATFSGNSGVDEYDNNPTTISSGKRGLAPQLEYDTCFGMVRLLYLFYLVTGS